MSVSKISKLKSTDHAQSNTLRMPFQIIEMNNQLLNTFTWCVECNAGCLIKLNTTCLSTLVQNKQLLKLQSFCHLNKFKMVSSVSFQHVNINSFNQNFKVSTKLYRTCNNITLKHKISAVY